MQNCMFYSGLSPFHKDILIQKKFLFLDHSNDKICIFGNFYLDIQFIYSDRN